LLIRDAGDGRILGIAGHDIELWHDKLVKTLKYTCVTMNVTVLSLYLIMRTPEWFSPNTKVTTSSGSQLSQPCIEYACVCNHSKQQVELGA
jgi:hypothetical protein